MQDLNSAADARSATIDHIGVPIHHQDVLMKLTNEMLEKGYNSMVFQRLEKSEIRLSSEYLFLREQVKIRCQAGLREGDNKYLEMLKKVDQWPSPLNADEV